MVGIYKITNLINRKIYIGKSGNIESRWKDHKRHSFDSKYDSYNCYIHCAIRKYGIDNFKFEVIEECKIEELDEKEKYWIKYYGTYPISNGRGYNVFPGGKSKSFKLSSKDVENIKHDLEFSTEPIKYIAPKYNVETTIIYMINSGKYYKDDNREYPIRGKSGIKRINKKHREKNSYSRKFPVPSKQELLIQFNNFNYNKEKVAEYFHVSEMLIKKWCNDYGFRPQQKYKVKELYKVEVLGEEIEVKEPKNYYLKVAQLNPETKEIIQIFDTLKSAAKYLNIKDRSERSLKRNAINGTLYRGYLWKIIK